MGVVELIKPPLNTPMVDPIQHGNSDRESKPDSVLKKCASRDFIRWLGRNVFVYVYIVFCQSVASYMHKQVPHQCAPFTAPIKPESYHRPRLFNVTNNRLPTTRK